MFLQADDRKVTRTAASIAVAAEIGGAAAARNRRVCGRNCSVEAGCVRIS